MWNGFLVAVLRIQPIVATLILMVAGRGIAQLITGGQIVTFDDPGLVFLSAGTRFTLPLPVAITLVVLLATTAAVVIGGTLLTGGSGFVAGTLAGVLIQGPIQTYITFDGTLSSWWTKIVIGILLFGFIVRQRALLSVTTKGKAQPAH